jgi:tetratricopeptide (TPR) repeat protein
MVEHKIQHHIVHSNIDKAVSLLEWKSRYSFDARAKRTDLGRAARLSFLRGDDPERSRRLLEEALKQPFYEETTQARMYLGNLAFDKDPEEGLLIWKEALLIDPKFSDAPRMWVRIASEYELLDNKPEAISAWNKVLSYKSVANTAHLALGRLKIKIDPEAALEHFQIVKSDTFMERTRAAELGERLAQWEIEKERE